MIARLPHGLAAASLALLLGGCLGLGGGKAPETLISLTAMQVPAAGSGVSATRGEALIVQEPEVDRNLAALRVPVRVNSSGLAYLADAAWVERPARQFRSLLAETLRASGKRLILEDDGTGGPAAARLGGGWSTWAMTPRGRRWSYGLKRFAAPAMARSKPAGSKA